MHSYFIRANLIFFFALSCLFVLAVGCSLTALFHNPQVEIRITNHKLLRLGQIDHPIKKGEQAILAFDVDAGQQRRLRAACRVPTSALFSAADSAHRCCCCCFSCSQICGLCGTGT